MFKKGSIAALSIIIAFIAYLFMSLNSSVLDDSITIRIPRGASTERIIAIFEKDAHLKNKLVTKAYLKFSGQDRLLRAGRYTIESGSSTIDIIKRIQEPQDLIKVTIPEGYSLKKIIRTLKLKGLIDDEEDTLRDLRRNGKKRFIDQFAFLNENPRNGLEGYLYPETYYFEPGTSINTIIASMLREFEKNIWQTWLKEEKPAGSLQSRFSFHEVLTFASIVEKEARIIAEMPKIASVYNNRLKKRMRLEADPTVLYALGEPDKKRVLYKDLRINSPFNTYRNFGLPPGPIASPSLLAFKAALNPEDTPYLYFVANPKTGEHIFAKTFDAHKANIKKVR